MSSDVVQVDRLSQTNKLGNMRLASIELIEKAMTYFGIKMLKTFEDADLFSTLIKFYGLFPFNDMVLKAVTNVISHAIDYDLANEDEKEMSKVVPKKPRFAFSLFDDEDFEDMNDQKDKDKDDEEEKDHEDDEQFKQEKDELLVHILFKTEMINVIVNGCMKKHLTEYSNSRNKIEVGYVTHLSRLAKLVSKVSAKNDLTQMGLEGEFPDWAEFESTVLQPRLQVREGELCKDSPKAQKRISFGDPNDDDDDLEPEPLRPLQFNRPDDYGGNLDDQRTNQAEIDRLMKPCLDFEDDDDDDNNDDDTALKLSDLENTVQDSYGKKVSG